MVGLRCGFFCWIALDEIYQNMCFLKQLNMVGYDRKLRSMETKRTRRVYYKEHLNVLPRTKVEYLWNGKSD